MYFANFISVNPQQTTWISRVISILPKRKRRTWKLRNLSKFIQIVSVIEQELDPRSDQLHRLPFTLGCINFSLCLRYSLNPGPGGHLASEGHCMLSFNSHNTCTIEFLIDIIVLWLFDEGFGVKHLRFWKLFFYSVATWPWENHFSSLDHAFLICRMRIIIISIS